MSLNKSSLRLYSVHVYIWKFMKWTVIFFGYIDSVIVIVNTESGSVGFLDGMEKGLE